jgi:hypothetical protein
MSRVSVSVRAWIVGGGGRAAAVGLFAICGAMVGAAEGADAPTAVAESAGATAADPPAPDRDAVFKELVTNVRLVGTFTIVGDESGELRREEYVISGAVKLGGDLWALTSRITYGDVDLTVPVPVQVKWAGSTPVITVDRVKIPGLGTFSARVLFDEGRYAGTWSHDETGGHLFGVIEKLPPPAAADPPASR